MKPFQNVIAYASVVFGILTTQLQSIHLPAVASAILGVFGILLHSDTSVNTTRTEETAG